VGEAHPGTTVVTVAAVTRPPYVVVPGKTRADELLVQIVAGLFAPADGWREGWATGCGVSSSDRPVVAP